MPQTPSCRRVQKVGEWGEGEGGRFKIIMKKIGGLEKNAVHGVCVLGGGGREFILILLNFPPAHPYV